MDDQWVYACRGTSEGWMYTISTLEKSEGYFARVELAGKRSRITDGAYGDRDEAIAAGAALAEPWIRDLRALEGYPEA